MCVYCVKYFYIYIRKLGFIPVEMREIKAIILISNSEIKFQCFTLNSDNNQPLIFIIYFFPLAGWVTTGHLTTPVTIVLNKYPMIVIYL